MRILKIGFLMLLLTQLAFSQSQMSSGDIKGAITDTSRAVIPNAKVTATNIDTGVARSVISDEAGSFRFFVLPPANYELKIEVQGFSISTRRPVQDTDGQAVIADAQLQLASLQQEVVIQQEAPLVETEKVQQ